MIQTMGAAVDVVLRRRPLIRTMGAAVDVVLRRRPLVRTTGAAVDVVLRRRPGMRPDVRLRHRSAGSREREGGRTRERKEAARGE